MAIFSSWSVVKDSGTLAVHEFNLLWNWYLHLLHAAEHDLIKLCTFCRINACCSHIACNFTDQADVHKALQESLVNRQSIDYLKDESESNVVDVGEVRVDGLEMYLPETSVHVSPQSSPHTENGMYWGSFSITMPDSSKLSPKAQRCAVIYPWSD